MGLNPHASNGNVQLRFPYRSSVRRESENIKQAELRVNAPLYFWHVLKWWNMATPRKVLQPSAEVQAKMRPLARASFEQVLKRAAQPPQRRASKAK